MKKLSHHLRDSFFSFVESPKTKKNGTYTIPSGSAMYFSDTMTRQTMKHLTRTPVAVIIVIALLTGLGGCTLMKNARYMARGTVSPARFHEVVPMIRQDKMVFLEVVIRGRKARFLFDTGAATVVSPGLAAELGLTALYSSGTSDTNRNKRKLDYVQLDGLHIGSVRFDEIIAAVLPLDAVPEIACWEIDGILGANCMRQADWLLDFESGTIELSHSDSTWLMNHKFPHTLGFTTSTQGSPYINVAVGQDTLKALLDTGSGIALSIPAEYFAKYTRTRPHTPLRKAVGIRSIGVFGAGLKADTTVSFLPDTIHLADQLHVSMITETGPAANIGLPLFAHFQVILNWRTKEVRLRQIEQPDMGNRYSFGMGVTLVEGALRVASLTQNGAASRAGLRLGDEVLAVGDWTTGPELWESLCIYRSTDWPDSVGIRYRRDGTEHTAVLQKEYFW